MQERRQYPYAAFDAREPNCLVVYRTDRDVARVYNNPTVDAGRPYLLDAAGQTFFQWDDYFREHPVQVGYYH
jgi:hypothetical protein